ncbi:MAG: protein kinase [Pirellulaceae bacterium]
MNPNNDKQVTPPSTHCDLQRVQTFLNSDHYHLEDAALISHLDECESCRAYMEAEAGQSEQWEMATRLLHPDEYDQAGSSAFSAATCCELTVNQPTAVQEVLDSLVPSEDPHRLGRLGTYEITGVVGVGGMGVVLKAIDPSLDRVVAVKVMNPRLANSEQARKRFAREAKAAAAVLHPNVIPIHSVSSDSKLPYLVMACIRGGSLQKRIQSEGPLPLVEVLRIGSQIAAGLAAAHEQGLIHRDIKPENILLEEGVERVTITDFGLARAVDDNTVTQHGAIAGTPQYMSPEQARGEQLDQQSDLFSLGCVLYAMCTGRPPFRDDTSYGVMRKIIDETPVPIQELNSEMPSWISMIVFKLMAKEKTDRFQSVNEVHKLLEACLSHVQQPQTMPLPKQLTAVNPDRSQRSILMKAIFGLVILAGSLVAMYASNFFQDLTKVNEKIAAQQEQQVVGPLSDLDSAIITMMHSPNDTVFLNLGGIGKDNSYLTFQPIDGGMLLRLPAFDTAFRVRQGPYVKRLRTVAESLSIEVSERSELTENGKVRGINYMMEILGEPKNVAETIRNITKQTFQVTDNQPCNYQLSIMPSTFSTKTGEGPKAVSAAEFLAEAQSGDRVYLGEQNNLIFLIPPAFISQTPTRWNSNIWSTDVRELSREQRDQIRKGSTQVTEIKLAQCAANQDFQPSDDTISVIDEIIAKAQKVEVPEWVTSPEDKNSFVNVETKKQLGQRICENLRQIRGVCPHDTVQYLNELQGLYLALKPRLDSTESSYHLYDQIACEAWPLALNGFSLTRTVDVAEFNKALVELTRPHAAIRANDRLAEAGKPTEPIGLDLQAGHALALARSGDLDGALRENGLFAKKLEVNQKNSRLSDLSLNFLDTERTPNSLLQQAVLQEALILGMNGKTTEAIEKSTLAGEFVTTDYNAEDQASIRDLLKVLDQVLGGNLVDQSNLQETQNTDHKLIQGEWQVIAAEDSGRKAPPEAIKEIRIVITDHSMTKKFARQEITSTYNLDASSNPCTIDVIHDGKTSMGIYELKGDTLWLCICEGEGERPTRFESQPNSGNDILLTLKRVTSDEAKPEAAPMTEDGPLSPEHARSLLPQATSISIEDFEAFQANPTRDTVESKSLSLVLLFIDGNIPTPDEANEFRFLSDGPPKPNDLARAMLLSRSEGYVTLLQPDYISNCVVTDGQTSDSARGNVSFTAPGLYSGWVSFEAQKHEGKWRIEKFELPSHKITILLDDDGIWQQK